MGAHGQMASQMEVSLLPMDIQQEGKPFMSPDVLREGERGKGRVEWENGCDRAVGVIMPQHYYTYRSGNNYFFSQVKASF